MTITLEGQKIVSSPNCSALIALIALISLIIALTPSRIASEDRPLLLDCGNRDGLIRGQLGS